MFKRSRGKLAPTVFRSTSGPPNSGATSGSISAQLLRLGPFLHLLLHHLLIDPRVKRGHQGELDMLSGIAT
jgi:hypothetical protein